MTCPSLTAHHFPVVYNYHGSPMVPVGFICDCGMTMSNGDGTYVVIEDVNRKHDYNCECLSCTQWFEEMQKQNIRGRCARCNEPLDAHPVKGTRLNGKKDCP